MPDFVEITDELEATAATEDNVATRLRRRCPSIVRQLQSDAERPAWLDLWGWSQNFDEHAGATIVVPAILAALSDIVHVDLQGEVVHAGVMHTYGYLFSNLQTPWGFKRDRWTDGSVEAAVGLPRGTLGPSPRTGTLLANLTYFLGRIAFRGRPRELRRLRRHRDAVAPGIVDFPYRSLRRHRIVERPRLPGGRSVELVTDLLEPNDDGVSLLVYWITDAEEASLVTTFAIDHDARTGLLESTDTPEIRTRYNAFVEGVTGRDLRGRREVVMLPG